MGQDYYEPCCRSVGFSSVPISQNAGLGVVEVSVPPAPCKLSGVRAVKLADGSQIGVARNLLKVNHENPQISRGVWPKGLSVEGGVVWWGQREPRVPQIMCDDCVAEMEASGEYNTGP